jgi:hypothetical protein
MTPSSRWVPKAKVRTVSFADPIVTAVWPQVECQGRPKDGGGKSGSLGAVNMNSSLGPSTSTRKVPHTVKLANVFTSIHNSLDSVLPYSSSDNLLITSTNITANTPAAQPIELSEDSELFTFQNCLNSTLGVCPGVDLGAVSPAGCLEPLPAIVNQDTSDNLLNLCTNNPANTPAAQPIEFSKDSELFTFQNCLNSALETCPGVIIGTDGPTGSLEPHLAIVNQYTDCTASVADQAVPADSGYQVPLGASPALGTGSHPQLLNFIAEITHPPEPPLIPTPPKRHTLKLQKQSITKRASVRLAAKHRFKSGNNRDAISKAQEILLAKLNNSAAKNVGRSKSLIMLISMIHLNRWQVFSQNLFPRSIWRQSWS